LRDLKSLHQVKLVNRIVKTDQRASERKIVRLTAGLEPYFVTANGARYYLGARLPSGYTVIDIAREHVWLVSDDGKERRFSAGEILQ
jgi:hypothetical protein